MAKKMNNQKKKGIDKIETVSGTETSFWNKFFVVLGVVCFFLIFYLLTMHITGNGFKSSDSEDATVQETSFSYDEIILGRSLSMDDEEYLVIFYDGKDEEISADYDSLVSNYRASEDHLNLYYVNMGSGFNKSFVTTEESHKSPETVNDFAINGPTLVLVRNHHVEEYIEGKDAITEYLS